MGMRSLPLIFPTFLFFNMKTNNLVFPISLIPLLTLPASACDSCAVYAASEAHGESTPGWFTSIAGQYTYFGTTQLDGHEVPNEADQYLDSTITQAVAGYNFTPRFGMQLNIPFI